MDEKPNLIVDLTFKFSLKIISFTEKLETERKFNMANQLFRSGTSIGANICEAQGAQSKADFKHKCKIAYKEAEETRYWLRLCQQAESYPFEQAMLDDIQSIVKVLGKIISSTN
ncbi:four helix bundle protein [Mucilaginibacter lappiensis]|uniref:Four helix bundle protein n=1 Tax=Mucilaginibacter lappiensis TaxID=354630 RepID=A0A1N7CDV8_9SPHI|nr:four helix bundle protein [Mucilaginibacter lappiensis]MBB6110869.1 four helix bundle protein [Mucilaginibacter lappiensis]MBB6128086.1 four helix bundle protein [Mucilaginibacter lappiensis]SIR61798.1 four helix bundle protein [Mucilaginibacter lappiensis]